MSTATAFPLPVKLFHSPNSPYSCKVMAVVTELGLLDAVERIPSRASPVDRNLEIARHNPSALVPTLVTADGDIFGSALICDYLAARMPGNSIVPASGPQRWQALRVQAMVDGILDAALLIRYESSVRPPALRWSGWVDAQSVKVVAGLDLLNTLAEGFGSRCDVGTLAAACLLDYLDERFTELDWRASRAALTVWYASMKNRPSLKQARLP